MNAAELLRTVRRIQIRTSHRVSEALAGQYHAVFRGQGIEFEEVRPYQVGDDVRLIDWNVSARFGEPYIKLFREERELAVMLVVDLSESLLFGSREQSKRELVTEMAATIAYSAVRNGDKVGLMIATDGAERTILPRKGSRQILRVIRELLAFEPTRSSTNLAAALEELERVQRRRAVVFVISDFIEPSAEHSGGDQRLEQVLRRLRRRHDLIPVVVGDPRERELPNVGLLELRDLETGRMAVVDTGSRAVRRRFKETADALAAQRTATLRRARTRAVELATGEDFVAALTRYFSTRGRGQGQSP